MACTAGGTCPSTCIFERRTAYRMPELKIYKSYPVYAPDREPAGYREKRRHVQPELAFDVSQLRTDADWVRAGELVFDAPVTITSVEIAGYVSDPAWNREHHVPVAKDGTVPFYRYVIREKGKFELGTLSCGNCHIRVLPDGSVVKGAQGNFPRAQSNAYLMSHSLPALGETAFLAGMRAILRQITVLRGSGTIWITGQQNVRRRPDCRFRGDACRNSTMSRLKPVLTRGDSRPDWDRRSQVSGPHRPCAASRHRRPDALLCVHSREHIERFWRLRVAAERAWIRSGRAHERLSALCFGALPLLASAAAKPQSADRTHCARRGHFQTRRLWRVPHSALLYKQHPHSRPGVHSARRASERIFHHANQRRHRFHARLANAQGNRILQSAVAAGSLVSRPLRAQRLCGHARRLVRPGATSRRLCPNQFQGVGARTRAVKGHEFGLRLVSDEKAALIAFLKTL